MKVLGILILFVGVFLRLYEKVIDPKKFKNPDYERYASVRAFREWAIIILGLIMFIFAPWACD